MTLIAPARGRRLAMLVILALGLFGISGSFATAAGAAEIRTHAFDAALSLTGTCEIEPIDEIPDPGCPGGSHPPAGRFNLPKGVAIDSYGDIYLSSWPESGNNVGQIDIFNSAGEFLTEIPFPKKPTSLAVDAEGHLYVIGQDGVGTVRFEPEVYEPAVGAIRYDGVPTLLPQAGFGNTSLAVDSQTEQLYALGEGVKKFGTAAEGNPFIEEISGAAGPGQPSSIAVDAATGNIYVVALKEKPHAVGEFQPPVVRVFSGTEPGHPLVGTITGSCVPSGHFGANLFGQQAASIAVEESTGHVFFDDRQSATSPRVVYEIALNGSGEEKCISTLEREFFPPFLSSIAIDNGAHSPNKGTVYVPSIRRSLTTLGHLFAFTPRQLAPPPTVQVAFDGVTESEAQLRATVNPGGASGSYRIEYTTQAHYEAEGGTFAGATLAGEGALPEEKAAFHFSASATGLTPGTTYRFRAVAENACETVFDPATECQVEAQGSFRTYIPAPPFGSCPNDADRTGLSVALPDCRAYELVTPADTNSHAPLASGSTPGPTFGTPPASPQGESVAFVLTGGTLAGLPGTGSFNGDPYRSTRTPTGWRTEEVGFDGSQSIAPDPGGFSPDQGYTAVYTGSEDPGSLAIGGHQTNYVRYPDGSLRLLGEGDLATNPGAGPLLISEDGTHIVFQSSVKLEPAAPPSGTEAVYDRTPDNVVHVVSLLPGDATPAAGEKAFYQGASADGSVVAFLVSEVNREFESPLYVRVDDSRTIEIAPAGSTFEGLSADGHYAFYLSGGDLHRYDTETEEDLQITTGAHATVVNIPAGGEGAYFSSPTVIGSGTNPEGAEPVAGEANLYYWDGAEIHFVATVTERDVKGEEPGGGYGVLDGLGLWAKGLYEGKIALDPSRSDPGGGVLAFSSRADLTGRESGGVAEIYRYDAGADSLTCLSCVPTGAPPSGQAWLELTTGYDHHSPLEPLAQIPNVSSDGRRIFFQTPDQLVPADTDGIEDVYEWETEGEGSCTTIGGCIYLISSGQSGKPNYLYGVSESGDDVFIYTSDLLTSEDHDETPSVYDARVDGGFPEAAGRAAECLGEACQPAAGPPTEQTTASSVFEGAGNVTPEPTKPTCPKGKKSVKQGGKWKCIAKSQKKHKKKSQKKSREQEKRAGRKGRSAR